MGDDYTSVKDVLCTTWYAPFGREFRIEPKPKSQKQFEVYHEEDLVFYIEQKHLKLKLLYDGELDDEAVEAASELEKQFMRLHGMTAQLNSCVLEWAQGLEVWTREEGYYEIEDEANDSL